jgi:hypothetical protein
VEQPRYESRCGDCLLRGVSRPLLLVVIAVARLAFGREAAQGAIIDELGGLIGGQTGAALEGMIASASLCQRAGRDG